MVAALDSKTAQEHFIKMFSEQGGRWGDFLKVAEGLSRECQVLNFVAPQDGRVAAIHARRLGYLLNELGGGRNRKEDTVDSMVGFDFKKEVGEPVKRGETIVSVYFRKERGMSFDVNEVLSEVIEVAAEKAMAPPVHWIGEVIQ